MSAAQPWMKFYPRDWRADEKLRVCSLAARGLWMEMLALMHGSERYGHLLINGKAPTDAQIAVLAGAPAPEIVDLLGELEAAGVFSRSVTGAIYSRRMTADERKAKNARKNGKRGGNPSLCNDVDNSASDNLQDKGGVKLRGQKPEGRDISAQVRATTLPDDWGPLEFTAGTQSRRIVESWNDQERARQLEAFRAHHLKKGDTFKDWQQAWATWALNSERFVAPSRRGTDPPSYLDHAIEQNRARAAAR